MKKRVIAAALAVLMGMSVTACSSQNVEQEINRVSVSGILPEFGDVVVTNTYIGTVAPKESITVYPMVSGNITEVSAAVGNQVKKGDVLFKLDSTETDLKIADAEEALEKAEKLAEQAEEDAKELEEALQKVEVAEEKADLELQVEAQEKTVAQYLKNYENAKDEYDELNTDYKKYNYSNGTSTKNRWSKEESKARQDELSMAKKYVDLQKSVYDTANSELSALKTELSKASKTTSSSTTSKSSSTTTKTTSSKDSNSKDSDDKDSDSKTSSDTTKEEVTVETTVYDQMVEDAKAAVEDAKAKLELYQIAAPIDGIIEAVYVEKNEKAFEDTACLVISNKSNIEVTFQVAEAAALELKTGDKIKVEKNGAMNEATITEVALMADPQTKLFTVKASLGSVTGFSTGTDVKVYAETQKVSNVMKLPYDTLYFQGDTVYVYCAVDEEAVRKTVQVGLMNEEYAQILDGLSEEDIVISTWSSQLKDGTEVDLLFVIGGNIVEVPEDEEGGLEGVEEPADETLEDTEADNTEDTEEEYQWVLPDMD